MEPIHSHEEIVELLKANQALLKQNNELLLSQDKREQRRLVFKFVWYAVLIGLPLIAYYYLYSVFLGIFDGVGSPTGTHGIGTTSDTIEQLLELYRGQ